MHSEIERYRELGALIRDAQRELASLRGGCFHSGEGHLVTGDPEDRVNDLQRQISSWNSEKKTLFRHISAGEEKASGSGTDGSDILESLMPICPGSQSGEAAKVA